MVVALLHLFPPIPIFLDLVEADFTVRLCYQPLQVGYIEIERLHRVEQLLRNSSLLKTLLVLIKGKRSSKYHDKYKGRDDASVLPLLLGLNIGKCLSHTKRMFTNRFALNRLSEVVLKVMRQRGIFLDLCFARLAPLENWFWAGQFLYFKVNLSALISKPDG